ERHGDVAPRGARELGLFHNDTRYLSQLELRIADVELVYLSAETAHDAFNQVDLMVSGLDEGEFLDDPQNFLHVSRRQLLDGGLVESITLTNFLSRPVALTLELAFDADFADIFEVRGAKRPRRGKLQQPRVTDSTVVLGYHGLDGVRYATEFSFAPQPSELHANCARFRLELVAGGSQQLEFRVQPQRQQQSSVRARIPFDHHIGQQVEATRSFRDASTRVHCDNAMLEHVFEQSVADLYALRVEVGSLHVVAAGIPWFCCPFGRDSLITSYEALTLNPELAQQSLRVLAGFQGKRDVERSEEEPGKIMHELRFGEMAATGEMPHSPYYGTIDATPLFVVVADAAYQVTGDLACVRELREPLLAALAWVDRQSDEAKQLVSYRKRSPRGLDNQGWKDSRAGVSFPDGRRAEPPIALCEVQGYCADAYSCGSRLLGALGERDLAAVYAGRAAALRALADELLWLPEQGRYAFAVDGRGRKLDTVVSNLGHLLWSRVPGGARARATADLLLAPASFSGFGIRTLATGQAVYNPLSYHNGTIWPHDNALIAQGFANYGMTQHAARVFEGLIHAMTFFRDRRLPELFCGMSASSGNLVRYPVACSPQAWASAAPFLLLQASLGLSLDAPNRRLSIRNASLPASLEWVELEGLRIGSTRITIRLRRAGERVHIERLDVRGPAIRTEVEID
ncbi:MAG TPA: glycogen debranching N-terminal domain-containing protein, partial [Polyangiales bacterium]|nr:glycogen debranching N-terminal domain-containing protein [Polyangiales bacterium]